MLYHQMLREKEVLDQREKNILERLQTYPAGKLIYSQNGKHKKWYISCDGQKIYIPSNEKNTAVSMAEKKYYEVMLQDIVQEKRAIQSYLDLCNKEQTGEEQLLETAVYAELLKKVTMENANEFLDMKRNGSKVVANATSMCISSPILLIVLVTMAEDGVFHVSESLATVFGCVFLLGMVAAAVFLFITYGMRESHMEHFEKECFETEYGVSGIVREKKIPMNRFLSEEQLLG